MIAAPAPPLTVLISLSGRNDVIYKVWVAIERIAADSRGEESYEDMGLPDPIGIFNTLEEAQEHVRRLPGWSPEGSDNRLRN